MRRLPAGRGFGEINSGVGEAMSHRCNLRLDERGSRRFGVRAIEVFDQSFQAVERT
jgi:hypothetical protein